MRRDESLVFLFQFTAKTVQDSLRKEYYNVRFDFIHCCGVIYRTTVLTPVLRLLPPADIPLWRFRRLGDGDETSLRSDVVWRFAPSPSPPSSYGLRTEMVKEQQLPAAAAVSKCRNCRSEVYILTGSYFLYPFWEMKEPVCKNGALIGIMV